MASVTAILSMPLFLIQPGAAGGLPVWRPTVRLISEELNAFA
jgi:hypothetical protein